jgi:hypothetical protein
MSDIAGELRQVLAELKVIAPGLTHIHAQIDGILAKLDGRAVVPAFDIGPVIGGTIRVASEDVPPEAILSPSTWTAMAFNPEFLAGVKIPANAKRVLEIEDDEPAEEWDEDEDLAHLDDEDEGNEPGDEPDAA